MYIEQTEIKNFKGIAEMSLEFAPGINLLIGNNGVGKTTVLEALSLSLQPYFSRMKGVTKKGITSREVRFETERVSDASQFVTRFHPTYVKSYINYDGNNYTCEVFREDETSATRTRYIGNEIAAVGKQNLNTKEAVLPLICYFSTSRIADTQRAQINSLGQNKLNDRVCGYMGCLDSSLDRKALTDWTFKMAMAEFKVYGAVAEYEAFKKAVGLFMQRMNDLDEMPVVEFSRIFEDLAYTEDGKTLPINYLSAGYQSLLWMLMEMAFRTAILNPGLDDYSQVGGVVFIDEIDMHLHPKWQWKVLDALHSSFPKIQFIVATHSPIIISSSKEARLLSIGEDGAALLHSAYAYSIDDVVSLRQRSLGIPQQLRKMTDAFEQAFYSRDEQAAQNALDKMIQCYGEGNTEVKRAQARMKLRKNWK